MLVDGSMTGVLKMPRLPVILVLPPKVNLAIDTGTAPTLVAKLTDHKGEPPTSASNAYSESLMVATYTTL